MHWNGLIKICCMLLKAEADAGDDDNTGGGLSLLFYISEEIYILKKGGENSRWRIARRETPQSLVVWGWTGVAGAGESDSRAFRLWGWWGGNGVEEMRDIVKNGEKGRGEKNALERKRGKGLEKIHQDLSDIAQEILKFFIWQKNDKSPR